MIGQLLRKPAWHALALVMMTGWAMPPLAAASDQDSAAPAMAAPAPLLVTRTVYRSLRDGKEIVARRTYRVEFSKDGGSWLANGTQIDSQIEAPAALQMLADFERARVDTGGFPFRLSADWLIRESTPVAPDSRREAGMAAAREMVGSARLSQADRASAAAFLTAATTRSQPVPWPHDLFSPLAQDRSTVDDITLADGTRGKVTISIRIAARLATGMPARLVREVTTEIGGTVRPSREEWTLVVAGPGPEL